MSDNDGIVQLWIEWSKITTVYTNIARCCSKFCQEIWSWNLQIKPSNTTKAGSKLSTPVSSATVWWWVHNRCVLERAGVDKFELMHLKLILSSQPISQRPESSPTAHLTLPENENEIFYSRQWLVKACEWLCEGEQKKFRWIASLFRLRNNQMKWMKRATGNASGR